MGRGSLTKKNKGRIAKNLLCKMTMVTATFTLSLINSQDSYVYVHMYFIPTYIRQGMCERICLTQTESIIIYPPFLVRLCNVLYRIELFNYNNRISLFTIYASCKY